jgi:hypothetical protein
MAGHKSAAHDWLPIIEGEYREMPGLRLTKAQIQRLWGLDPSTCNSLLETLEACHVLRQTRSGRYMLADSTMIVDGQDDERSEPEVEVPACATF